MTTQRNTKTTYSRKSPNRGNLRERLATIILGIGVVICGVLVSPTVKESTAAVDRIQKASSNIFFEQPTNPNMGLNVVNREDQRDLGNSHEVQSSSPFNRISRHVERGLQLIGGNEVFIAQR